MAGRDRVAARNEGIEVQPALEDRGDGADPQFHTAGAQRGRHARGVPEPGRGRELPVEGRQDEGVYAHLGAVGRQARRRDLAHFDAPEQDGSARPEAGAVLGAQGDGRALDAGRNDRGTLVPLETGAGGTELVIPGALNVGARQDGVEPLDAARRNCGLHDPEARVLVHVGRDVLVDADVDVYLAQVGGEAHVLDHAHGHFAVA